MKEVSGFGNFIEAKMRESGYKRQRHLANATGISSATLSRIISEVQRPQPETLRVLALSLKSTTLVELMNECGYGEIQKNEPMESNRVMQITKEHLAFLDEAIDAFEESALLETYRNDEGRFIALRYGRGRDCVQIYELGSEVGFFANMFPSVPRPPDPSYG